jgi:hypothetical protein
MRQIVRLVAGVAAAATIILVAASCRDDDEGVTEPPVSPRVYTAVAFGSNEVNDAGQPAPTGNPGRVLAVFVDRTTQIDWSLRFDNIEQVTMSHIHGPALPNQNAGVIFDLFIPPAPSGALNGRVETGTITGSATVSLDSLRTLLNASRAYVNVHTTPLPAGAVRGQIVRTN